MFDTRTKHEPENYYWERQRYPYYTVLGNQRTCIPCHEETPQYDHGMVGAGDEAATKAWIRLSAD